MLQDCLLVILRTVYIRSCWLTYVSSTKVSTEFRLIAPLTCWKCLLELSHLRTFNMDFHKIHWLLRFNSLQCLKWFSIVKALEDAGIRRTYCVSRNFVDTFNFQYSDQRFWTLNKQCIDRWSKFWFEKYKRFYHFTQDMFDCTTNIKY